ncbi:MAG: regulatory protein [Solirubrobacterales bacterium]|jgi:regulatory protein|nr:regulatory protein [Solirubrobacterales bacterium]MDX6662819.1 regulatory protein [Solirubrobacterales bacterium]
MIPSELTGKALAALTRKELTVAEMAAWLESRGATEDDVTEVLAELSAAGALDDERFARGYAEDKRELAGWGDERIRAALGQRGVSAELIESALAGDDEGELERAVAVLRRRGEAADDDAARGRCFAALARRGYDAELAYAAVAAYERRLSEPGERAA